MANPIPKIPPKPELIIGIDPDVDKSGVACLHVGQRSFLYAETLSFPRLVKYLHGFHDWPGGADRVHIVVEASWKVTGNWHLNQWERRQKAAAKGYDVGRNHETGRKICEMARAFGLEVIEHIPLRKCWKGPDRKITHEELAKFTDIDGLCKRTNQEVRDAALLAWSVSGFPIRL